MCNCFPESGAIHVEGNAPAAAQLRNMFKIRIRRAFAADFSVRALQHHSARLLRNLGNLALDLLEPDRRLHSCIWSCFHHYWPHVQQMGVRVLLMKQYVLMFNRWAYVSFS
jgi:hypothetical protein